MAIYKHTCQQCHLPFETVGHKNQKFCSNSCSLSARAKPDNNIFRELNSTSAYVLGFIWADGCLELLNRMANGRPRAKLTISSSDYELINKIHQLITPNKKLYTSEQHGGGLTPLGDYKTHYKVITQDMSIIHAVEHHGLIPRKSNDLWWPRHIPNKYFWDFIRGFFDGDGCVYHSHSREYDYLNVKFTCGTQHFLETMKDKLTTQGIDSKIIVDTRSNTPGLVITRKDSIYQLWKKMYKNSPIHLERKKIIFDNYYGEINAGS